MSMLLWSCGEEAEEMPDWDITLTPVNEAYSGETATVEVKVSKAVEIQLLVDGSLVESTLGGSLVYDVSSLSVGNHTVKVSIDDGYGVYEKSFSCRIVAKSVMDNTNDKPNDNNPNDNNPNDNKPNDNKPEVLSYEYVDLGLPSGTLWADRNVGAENPWDYGDYFAWGETSTKLDYCWATYKYANGNHVLTKYCDDSLYGNDGFTDNQTVLLPEDDAATANMGSNWRMPTKEELQELIDNCEVEWTSDYQGTGVAGCIVWDTYSHSAHIFLPASGFRDSRDLSRTGTQGYYWSSYGSIFVWEFFCCSEGLKLRDDNRYYGQTVRAVRCR